MSEAAFFDNSEDLSSGLMKTVLDIPGTEIIMESTGNGASGMFLRHVRTSTPRQEQRSLAAAFSGVAHHAGVHP